MSDTARQRTVTYVGHNDEVIPRIVIQLGYLIWHEDEPDWIEWQLEPLTKKAKRDGFIQAPCWINSQVRT